MIRIIKKEINMSKELLSKIEWTCKMKQVKPEIINGTLVSIAKEMLCGTFLMSFYYSLKEGGNVVMNEERKVAGIYIRVSTEES